MMIALGYVMDTNESGMLAGNSETHGIRGAIFRKVSALATCVPEIAVLPQNFRVGQYRLRGARPADATVQCTQWVAARSSPSAVDTGCRIEEGARHRRYSNIEALHN
jgi:hypothetical protein